MRANTLLLWESLPLHIRGLRHDPSQCNALEKWFLLVSAGPGLAVRILGDVTEGDKLEVLRHVDEIFINTIRDFGLYDDIWQAFAVFLPVK